MGLWCFGIFSDDGEGSTVAKCIAWILELDNHEDTVKLHKWPVDRYGLKEQGLMVRAKLRDTQGINL